MALGSLLTQTWVKSIRPSPKDSSHLDTDVIHPHLCGSLRSYGL